ncbi:MAG TPA: nucleoside triphosphate pyrophosphohydrolase [Fimbriimonas sp.]
MVRVIDLTRVQLTEELLAEMREKPLFALGNPALYERLFRDRGLEPQPAARELPEGSVLVVFPSGTHLDELVAVTDRLLGPGGCPWDQAQTHESLKSYLLEESYEVLDAIDTKNPDLLAEELGDLLLQPVLHAQISKKNGGFDIQEVARRIVAKLVHRHPHVFGDLTVKDAEEVLQNWDRIKSGEKGNARQSILAGVPKGMASLLRAYEVSKRAVRVGFEWPDIESVFAKLREEEIELREALLEGDRDKIESEVGDLLFTCVNIARWSKVEPEEALRKMLNRFTARFMEMERLSPKNLTDLSFKEWDDLWEAAKASTASS